MAGRVVGGLRTLWHRVTASYGYAEFVAVYLIALLLLFGQNWRRSQLALSGFHPCVTLFVVGYFGGYTLLYAWYTPIGVGNRFELSLFLPLLLVILTLLSLARAHDLRAKWFGRQAPAWVTSPTVLLVLVAYLITVFPYRVSTMFGGD